MPTQEEDSHRTRRLAAVLAVIHWRHWGSPEMVLLGAILVFGILNLILNLFITINL